MNKYLKPTDAEDVEAFNWKLKHLESQLTGELSDEQFDIQAEIGEIKRLLASVGAPDKPSDSPYECFGCGS
mgnify:CR=1 FL=1|jgi:hypothetical protein